MQKPYPLNKPIHAKTTIELKNSDSIDTNICLEIDSLTTEDNTIWTSPDYKRREYVHNFFQYPAMMIPVVQKKIIDILCSNRPDINNVLDPFMGSGTSLVASMEKGLNCYGQDVNPLAVLVTKTRTGPFYPTAIRVKILQLLKEVNDDKLDNVEVSFPGLTKWFKNDVSIELSKLVRSIRKEKRPAIRRFFWVVLAETIRLTSNDRTSTFKLHSRSLDEIAQRNNSPLSFFKKHINLCLEDIDTYSEILKKSNRLTKGAYNGIVNLSFLNSKVSIYTPNGVTPYFDLIVTSPPYGDNQTTVTYGQHSFLPLQWIDLQDIDRKISSDVLFNTSVIDRNGLGGRIRKLEQSILDELFAHSATLQIIYNKLVQKDPLKVKKVLNFFNDIYLSIGNIDKSLKPNAYQIWTIGNRNVAGIEIPNNIIMSEFIQSKGGKILKILSREILNKRMARKNNSTKLMNSEEIIIFKKSNGN
jgi:hypothetical protein